MLSFREATAQADALFQRSKKSWSKGSKTKKKSSGNDAAANASDQKVFAMPAMRAVPTMLARCATEQTLGLEPLSTGDLDCAQLAQRILLMRPPWHLPTNPQIPRNNVDDVATFLDRDFPRRYQIFSIERAEEGGGRKAAVEGCGFARFRDQALVFRTAVSTAAGGGTLRAPPPLGLLCGLCSSALFWRDLDRQHNVCVLQVSDSSAATLLLLVALLVALDVVSQVGDALRHLQRFASTGSRSCSAITFTEVAAWSPSLQRYLRHFQELQKLDAGKQHREPDRLCLMLISIEHFTKTEGDIVVEVYENEFNEESRTCELRLLADSSNYMVQHSRPEEGTLLLDMSPRGHRPLWIQGDVAIVIREVDDRASCRYFFHTSFVKADLGILSLCRADLDIDRDAAARVPDGLAVKLVLSDGPHAVAQQPPGTAALAAAVLRSPQMPVGVPRGDASQFIRFHSIEADVALHHELTEGGFNEADAGVALRISRNTFVDAIGVLSRYFPVSAEVRAWKMSSWLLFSQALDHSGDTYAQSIPTSDSEPEGRSLSDEDGLQGLSGEDLEEAPKPDKLMAAVCRRSPSPSTSSTFSDVTRSTDPSAPSAKSAEDAGLGGGFSGSLSASARLAGPPPPANRRSVSTFHDTELQLATLRLKKPASAVKQARPRKPLVRPRAVLRRPGGTGDGVSVVLGQSNSSPALRGPSGTSGPSGPTGSMWDAQGGGGSDPARSAGMSRGNIHSQSGPIQTVSSKAGSRGVGSLSTTRARLGSSLPQDDSPMAWPMPEAVERFADGTRVVKSDPASVDGSPKRAPQTAEKVTASAEPSAAPLPSPPPPPTPTPPGKDVAAAEVLEPDPVVAPKGKGKGSAAPPPPKGKGKGKDGKNGPGSKGAGGKAKNTVAPAVLPLGIKYHWKPLAEHSLENTVWAELDSPRLSLHARALGESSPSAPGLPPDQGEVGSEPASPGTSTHGRIEVLEQLFKKDNKKTGSGSAAGAALRAVVNKGKAEQVTFLDQKRAQNVGIIIRGLGFANSELCDRLRTISAKGLDAECIEKCAEVMPTEEEVKRLAAYRGDPASLRDVERQLLPLCAFNRLPQRIQLMTLEVRLGHVAGELARDLGTLVTGAEQVRSSKKLRAVLRVVLVLGNFMNHGSTDGSDRHTKGFSVESLPKLRDMKSPVHPSVTMLHYVAHIVSSPPKVSSKALPKAEAEPDAGQLSRLTDELSLASPAARVSMHDVRKELDLLGEEAKLASTELKQAARYEAEAAESIGRLQMKAELKLDELTASFNECERSVLELQHFFGEDPKLRSVNDLFTTLHAFAQAFDQASSDLRNHPARFAPLLRRRGDQGPAPGGSGGGGAAGKAPDRQTSKRSSLPAGIQRAPTLKSVDQLQRRTSVLTPQADAKELSVESLAAAVESPAEEEYML